MKFLCFWDCTPAVIETHDADFFCKDNGYSESDIETVSDLTIGESADLSAGTQTHYVLRIK